MREKDIFAGERSSSFEAQHSFVLQKMVKWLEDTSFDFDGSDTELEKLVELDSKV